MIKDYQLMAIVCVLVALDVLVLSVWEFIDPLHITFYNKTLEQIVSGHVIICQNHWRIHGDYGDHQNPCRVH